MNAERPAVSGDTPTRQSGDSLTGEHAQLLAQVSARARDLLAVAAQGRWPERELQALAAYLRAEVIRQIRDEERLLLPTYGTAPVLAWLTRDHARLRAAVDTMVSAAGGKRRCSVTRLATMTRDLVTQLSDHFATEERLLAGLGTPAAATAALGAHPHRWYALTEGPVVDLDALPPAKATEAVTDRLRRLRRDEEIELRSSHDLNSLCWWLSASGRGDYGFAYLREGPDQWHVRVTRRR
jgi:uncharacterized protein (DUF2249 family)